MWSACFLYSVDFFSIVRFFYITSYTDLFKCVVLWSIVHHLYTDFMVKLLCMSESSINSNFHNMAIGRLTWINFNQANLTIPFWKKGKIDSHPILYKIRSLQQCLKAQRVRFLLLNKSVSCSDWQIHPWLNHTIEFISVCNNISSASVFKPNI